MRYDASGAVKCCNAGFATFAAYGLAMVISLACVAVLNAADGGRDTFGDGWRKEVLLTDPNGGNKTPHCVAWVDDGWLVVERRDTANDVEWQIVLAQVDGGDEPPKIEVNPRVPGGLRLMYRDGRYFIREDLGHLRCLRQRKSADAIWPALAIPANDVQPGGSMMGNADRGFYYGRTSQGWQVIARGREGEMAEYVLRMYCLEVGGPQLSGCNDGSRVDEWTVGATHGLVRSSTLVDDGELLVVSRMHEGNLTIYRAEQEKLEAKRKDLVGASAPAITAAKWLNGKAIAIDDLKGKVALIYFTGGYSKRVADQLSAIDQLYGKYAARGLEVAAVIPAGDEETYAAICEKRAWRFPLAVDQHGGPTEPISGGPTAQRFFVTDSPCVFLLDRNGKIALSQYPKPLEISSPPLPLPEEIEKLLGAD